MCPPARAVAAWPTTDRLAVPRASLYRPARADPTRWPRPCEHSRPCPATYPRSGLSLGRGSQTRFVDDARIPLDNNATERAIRGPVVGRRNHFGSKSRLGTQVAATLYTILETAKLHDIDPAKYVAAAVIAADRGELLLPWDYAAAAAAAVVATAVD